MHAEHSIAVLESLATLSGNPEMPLSQAISALRALAPTSALTPAPAVRAPVVNTAHFDEAVSRANLMDMLPQATEYVRADAISAVQPLDIAQEPAAAAEPAPVKKRRGRPRKNKA